jgi:16S rRNA (cytosine967-C5)-methyltransferase
MALCDYYIDYYSSVKLSKIQPVVLDILRMGTYQLLFLDKIPTSAAVNEAVKLTKKYNPKTSGFVNAILRKIAAKQLPEINTGDKITDLSVKYSHPRWLVERLCDILGNNVQEYLKENNEPVPITVQINTIKTSENEFYSALDSAGISYTKSTVPCCCTIEKAGSPEGIPHFADGWFYVQDAAAVMSVMASGVQPGMNVIDGCSAPGGKTFAAGIRMKNNGNILSCDIHTNKLVRIEQGADRLGISIVKTKQADGRDNNEQFNNFADVVIADVPCSGMGVIRKKPEIRYKEEQQLKSLPDIQLSIVRNLSRYVKPGGVLLYSTCTVLPEENEGVVDRFLSENRDFEREAFALPAPVGQCNSGMVTLWPHIHGTDGFFICKLRRKNET